MTSVLELFEIQFKKKRFQNHPKKSFKNIASEASSKVFFWKMFQF